MVKGFVSSDKIADAFARTITSNRIMQVRAEKAQRRAENMARVTQKFILLMQVDELIGNLSPEDIADEIPLDTTFDLGDLFGRKIHWTIRLSWIKGDVFARLHDERGRVIVWTRVNGLQSDEPEAHAVHKLGLVIRRKLMRMAVDNRDLLK